MASRITPPPPTGLSGVCPKGLFRGFLLAIMVTMLPTCSSVHPQVPSVLRPTENASLSQLVGDVNQRQRAETLMAEADVTFEIPHAAHPSETTRNDSAARRLLSARAKLILTREGPMRMEILDPMLGNTLAVMVANDGGSELTFHAESPTTSNDSEGLESARTRTDRSPELEGLGVLIRVRPQDITRAFFFESISLQDPDSIVTMEEAQMLVDTPAEDRSVVKPYYILSVARRGEDAARSRFWFDRSDQLFLARWEREDSEGLVLDDVRYSGYLYPDTVTGLRFPADLHIDIPPENLSIRMTLDPTTLSINGDIPPNAFSLTPR